MTENTTQAEPKPKSWLARQFRFGERERFMVMLVAPAITILFLFQVVPIVIGTNASFRDWTLHDPQKTWVGLQKYASVLSDGNFLELVLPNTIMFMVFSVSVSLVLGLCLALMLNRKFFGQAVVQTILLLPLMVAPVVAAIMLRWMFNDQFGIINVIVGWFGIPPQAWLVERWSAFAIVVGTDVWLWTPWFTLLLLAGLQSLPKEPFEAAAIDGAGKWRTFTHLTLPMLRPVIVVCVVIRSIDAFRVFDIVWTLTEGGPARATEVFSVYAYIEAFQGMDFAKGSAAAVIGGSIILVIGMGMYWVLNRVTEVSR
jgi:multiple sugar transport system permease protein